MKNSWIKPAERLPDLLYVNDNWSISTSLLLYTRKNGFALGSLNLNKDIVDELIWYTKDNVYKLNEVLYWQPLEKPLLEDLRDTQNYYLST